jgi:hypothetical protein
MAPVCGQGRRSSGADHAALLQHRAGFSAQSNIPIIRL